MTEVISVRFNSRGKIYFFDPSGLTVKKGDYVIVETAKGIEYGECIYSNHLVSDNAVVKPLRPVVRLATDSDKMSAQEGKGKEKEAFDYCLKKIEDFGLDMKLVDVEYGFEGSKILFFFTSEGRVDFRELVKDLAGTFRTRIELRQIGVRDEAKMLGGLGICGRVFCCCQFLGEFHPVTIKMAKTQGLSLNPTKISGTCGRLMCCLKYEENAYEDLVKKAPKIDAFVDTPSGKGTVINVNLLRGNAKVRLEEGLDTTLKTFTFDELDILGGKGRRAEYIAAKAEGKLEEAGFKPTPPPVLRHAAPSDVRTAPKTTRDAGQTKRPADRQERKNEDQPRNKAGIAGISRPLKSAEKGGKPQRTQHAEKTQSKKPHFKRNRSGRGKNTKELKDETTPDK